MNKLGRNDKCYCKSGKKYKKCCLQKNTKNQQPQNLIGTLKRVHGKVSEKDDFYARYIFGLSKMRDAIYPSDKRLEYDKSFSPVFQNLLEAKYAKEWAINLINKYNLDIEQGKDGILQHQQLNINNPIDNELNIFFKDVFIRGSIAIDCLMKHTEYMGYGIGFLFSNDDKKNKKGIKKFPIPETDEKFVYLQQLIHSNKTGWYTQFREMRRQIEHFGYKLPEIKHIVDSKGKVTPNYPFIGNQTIEEVLNICWNNLSKLCEEIIVYITSLKLPDHLIIVMIPPEQRDKLLPLRYDVRLKDFPDANFSCS